MRVHELQDLLLIVRISDGGVFLDVSMGTGRRCMKEGKAQVPPSYSIQNHFGTYLQ